MKRHRPRLKPKRLAAKLLQIRQRLGLSQSQLVRRLNVDIDYCRISEYEHDRREPNLMVLLAYARVAKVRLEKIVDDELDI